MMGLKGKNDQERPHDGSTQTKRVTATRKKRSRKMRVTKVKKDQRRQNKFLAEARRIVEFRKTTVTLRIRQKRTEPMGV